MALCLFATLAFPIWQAWKTGGYVYYLNGLDEYTYLQYDYSRAVQGIARPGQFLVTLGHGLGLSGGWLDVVFDLVTFLAFPLLVRAVFRRLGWETSRANAAAAGMLLWPMLATTANPLMTALRNWVAGSGALYWFNVPELYTPALARSPEPQFTLLLLACIVWVALRWRSFWPVYVVVPFTYPFVAIPTAFVTLACHLHARWPWARFRVVGPLLLPYVALSVAMWIYNGVLTPPKTRDLLIASHLPLISFTSLVALPLVAAFWKGLELRWRFFSLALALAPLVASNTQVICGFMLQPNNYEQYAGVFILALVLVLGLAERARLRHLALVLGALVFLRSSYVTFRVNQVNQDVLPLTPALLDAMRTDPAHTVVDSVFESSLLALVLPREGLMPLSFQPTYVTLADRYIDQYRCLKQRVNAERPGDPHFTEAFQLLDMAYKYGSQDFPFANLGRRRTLKVLQDVCAEACKTPDAAPLRYFSIKRTGVNSARSGADK